MRTSGKANIRLQYRLYCHHATMQIGTIRVMHSPISAKKVQTRQYRYRTNAAPEIKVGDAVQPGPIKHNVYSIYSPTTYLLFIYQPIENMMNIRIVYASNNSQTHMSHIKLMRPPSSPTCVMHAGW
jgi:hypothetical protein